MRTTARDALSDRAIWILVGTVSLCVLLIIVIVNLHDKEKPESPQAVAAAAFNQLFSVKEWKPGMGSKPFMYHPAGFNQLFSAKEWKPGMGSKPFMYHPAGLNQPVWRPLSPGAGLPTPMMGTGSQISPRVPGGITSRPGGTNGGWKPFGRVQP